MTNGAMVIKDRCRQHYTRSRIGIGGKINAINHETNVSVQMTGADRGAAGEEVGMREGGSGSQPSLTSVMVLYE